MNNQPASMDAQLEGSNPKLQTVKYVNLLPNGKQGDYTAQNRIDYMPDPTTVPYFDGKQSYLNLQITNTSTFQQGNSGNPATADPPMCFPAHMGANAIINRCLLRAKDNGQVIEDIEAYNMLNGIKNAYTNDSDVFKTLGRITGVAGRTCDPANQAVDNQAINYFIPNGSVTANAIAGGNTKASAQFCVPIETGLMSAFANQHHVVPNLDVPLHFQFFLEKDNVALQVLSSEFYQTVNVDGVAVVHKNYQSPLSEHAGVKAAADITLGVGVCDTSLTIDGEAWDVRKCAFRIGQAVMVGADTRIITAVEGNTGAGSNQIKITVDVAFGAGDGAVQLKMAPITRGYKVDKAEMKLLLTIPDQPTMRMIRSQMARGISFASSQLYKLSTAPQLKNSVLDIPEALTRVMSMLAVPVQQDNLEALDLANSYVYCRPDPLLNAGNDNQVSYQWQVQNTLIPNLEVDTNSATNNANDNSIYFNQVVMALRHMLTVKALSDNPLARKTEDIDIELPYFFPISLSPVGQSFNLINSAPQLRINNSSATPANILAKLYFIFAVHTRVLKSTEMGAEISF